MSVSGTVRTSPYGLFWLFSVTISKLSTSNDHILCPVLTLNEFNLTVLIKISFFMPKQQCMSQIRAYSSTQKWHFSWSPSKFVIFFSRIFNEKCSFKDFWRSGLPILRDSTRFLINCLKWKHLFPLLKYTMRSNYYTEMVLLSRWNYSCLNSRFSEMKRFPFLVSIVLSFIAYRIIAILILSVSPRSMTVMTWLMELTRNVIIRASHLYFHDVIWSNCLDSATGSQSLNQTTYLQMTAGLLKSFCIFMNFKGAKFSIFEM